MYLQYNKQLIAITSFHSGSEMMKMQNSGSQSWDNLRLDNLMEMMLIYWLTLVESFFSFLLMGQAPVFPAGMMLCLRSFHNAD